MSDIDRGLRVRSTQGFYLGQPLTAAGLSDNGCVNRRQIPAPAPACFVFEMDNDLPAGLFELRRQLDEAGIFHRVGSLREETVLIEVRLPASFWEIEFHSDGSAEYEVFRSTGAILDAGGFIELVVRYADQAPPQASLQQQLSELNVMRLLRAAGISFSADEMLMRKVMVEGAIMIEVAVPGERWEIDVLANGAIEVERFRSEVGVHDFDTEALRRLLSTAVEAPAHRRKGLRG